MYLTSGWNFECKPKFKIEDDCPLLERWNVTVSIVSDITAFSIKILGIYFYITQLYHQEHQSIKYFVLVYMSHTDVALHIHENQHEVLL